jgi:hypothetical protein
MTTNNNYLIAYSNTTKPSINLTPGQIDATSTSLTLFGYGAKEYGKGLMSNTVKLLENFCNTTAPNNPIEGQLWFNSSTATLNVCYRATGGSLSWKSVAPVGGWDSTGGSTTSSITVESGAATKADLSSYIPINGLIGNMATGSMTGDLKLYNNPNWYTTNAQGLTVINEAVTADLSNCAATRKYVDLKVGSVVVAQNKATDWNVTPAQLITMIESGASPYIKRVATNPTDNVMVSPLILRNQSNPQTVGLYEAVNKQYVTSVAESIVTGMSTGTGTVPQYIKDLLLGYVPIAGISNSSFTGITSHLPVLDEPSWYNADGTLSLTAKIPNNYAATIRYVNTKVADALKSTGGGINWPVSSSVVIAKINEDAGGGPYIHKNSTDAGFRTMAKQLFLRSDQTADNVVDKEAVSAGVVRTLINNSKPTDIDSAKLLAALNALPAAVKPWPTQTNQQASIDTTELDKATKAANEAAKAAADALSELKKADSNDADTLDKLIKNAEAATKAANEAAGAVNKAATDAAGKAVVTTPGIDTVSSGLTDLIGQANEAARLANEAIKTEAAGTDTLTKLIKDAEAAAQKVTDAIALAGRTTITTNTTSGVDVSGWNNTTVSPTLADTYTQAGKVYMKDRERISYSKLPDGTLIISGYYRKFGLCHAGDAVDWVTSIDKIRFPSGYNFIDPFYSVTITEVSHNTRCADQIVGSSDARHRGGFWDGSLARDGWYNWPGAALLNCDIGRTYTAAQLAPYPQGPRYPWAETKNESFPTGTAHPSSDPPADFEPYIYYQPSDILGVTYNNEVKRFNSLYNEFAVPPCTWMSYDQATDGFKISGCVNKAVTWLYARNTLSCNFTAIGRWK